MAKEPKPYAATPDELRAIDKALSDDPLGFLVAHARDRPESQGLCRAAEEEMLSHLSHSALIF